MARKKSNISFDLGCGAVKSDKGSLFGCSCCTTNIIADRVKECAKGGASGPLEA